MIPTLMNGNRQSRKSEEEGRRNVKPPKQKLRNELAKIIHKRLLLRDPILIQMTGRLVRKMI
jgi:hypothetical protein